MTDRSSALATAVFGTRDLEAATRFYSDIIGFEVASEVTATDTALTRHWHVPPGKTLRGALLQANGNDIGQILLLEVDGGDVPALRSPEERAFVGLFNINLYVKDIRTTTDMLKREGFTPWADPIIPAEVGPQGTTLELLFDGPDGVIINVVQLYGGDEDTVIGKLRADVEAVRFSARGSTTVATTTHTVADTHDAIAFYRTATGMQPILELDVGSPEANRMMGRPEHGTSHVTLMSSKELCGKVLCSHPTNYSVPNVTERTLLPGAGYWAHSFRIANVDKAIEATRAPVHSPANTVDVPGLGPRRAALVRCPGSGALTELIED